VFGKSYGENIAEDSSAPIALCGILHAALTDGKYVGGAMIEIIRMTI
jgi:hypothetical protein